MATSTTAQGAVGRVAIALSDELHVVAPLQVAPIVHQDTQTKTKTNALQQVVHVHGDADAQTAVEQAFDALKQGKLVTLIAPSPDALAKTLPALHKLSRALLPAVVHVFSSGHAELTIVQDSGVAILASLRASEVQDVALLAHVAAVRARVPFLHVLDGYLAQHESIANVPLVASERLAELLEREAEESIEDFRQRVLIAPSEQAVQAAELLLDEGPERSTRFQEVPRIVEQIAAEAFADKSYRLFEYSGPVDATSVVVALGAGAAPFQDAIDAQQDASVGVVSVRLLRPWATSAFLQVVPRAVRRIAVVEATKEIGIGAPLFLSVVDSFHYSEWEQRPLPDVLGITHAPVGRVSSEAARSIIEQLVAGTLQRGVFVDSAATSSEVTTSDSPVSVASDISSEYLAILRELFGRRALIANLLHASTVWVDGDDSKTLDTARLESSEFGLGVHLALLTKRQQLKEQVSAWLKKAESASSNPRLVELLQTWLTATTPQDDVIDEIAALLESEREVDSALDNIYAQRRYLDRPSQWILGSEAFSRDLGASGVHQVLASGENVKLLILDTEPREAVSKTVRKRDIGLYALQYGNAYVASVALHDSPALVRRALAEADAFDGPAIVLAYAPVCADPEGETKEAVSSAYWPLYRYDPRLEDVAGEEAFVLESATIKKELQAFLDRSNQLSLFAKEATTPAVPAPSLTTKIAQLGQASLQSSFQALLHGLNAQPEEPWQREIKLSILVGSDNGHAEDIATRFQEEALRLGLREVSKADMNDWSVESLQDAANDRTVVLFVCATAGQGEFPSNAKGLWEQLASSTATLPLQYAVFGLGDSNYWTREDEQHYFGRAPRELDRKLSELGATRTTEIGVADDQDEDGPSTRFEAWKPTFWANIGIPAEAIERAQGSAPTQRTNEDIKRESNYLRGTIAQALDDRSTTAIPPDDTQLTKFHGIYMQDNRDAREAADGKTYTFMIRVRVPGGVSTTAQYLMIDQLADAHANGNIKITTRQAYQLQGILKWNLRATVQGLNRVLMDSLAACGDVNRNVMTSCTPTCSRKAYEEILDTARSISAHLSPHTSAYHEIWLDRKMVAGGAVPDVEPLYGETYLPRKFKIAIAIPPSNDVDVFANCLGFIAVIEGDHLVGFNVTVGGGMGMTHNMTKTFPRLADVLGFCTPEQAQDVAEKVMVQQRDLGDRKNRRHARYKYTVEDHGLAWIREDLERRLGYQLEDARPFSFDSHDDRFGWHKMESGKFFYTLFLEGGRIKDTPELQLRTGLRALAQTFPSVEFHLTPNQNLSIVGIDSSEVPAVTALLHKFRFGNDQHSAMRLSSIACAALPFCPLSFAEAERYLPSLVSQIDDVLDKYGLREDSIVIRMTGCPNGCARPYLGEIGLVGRAPGIYHLYLGAGYTGDRLNRLYKPDVAAEEIVTVLEPIIRDYAEHRDPNERFGDFVIRQGYVEACKAGPFVVDRAPGESFHP